MCTLYRRSFTYQWTFTTDRWQRAANVQAKSWCAGSITVVLRFSVISLSVTAVGRQRRRRRYLVLNFTSPLHAWEISIPFRRTPVLLISNASGRRDILSGTARYTIKWQWAITELTGLERKRRRPAINSVFVVVGGGGGLWSHHRIITLWSTAAEKWLMINLMTK